MIYLDSAATTLIKPRAVGEAVLYAVNHLASPGRGGHEPAMRAADTAWKCREELSDMFHAKGAENVVFTSNATHALNIAIASTVSAGDRVVVSGYEHNAVIRPLHMLGADIDIVRTPLFDTEAAIEGFAQRIPGAAAVVCTHVSNVFGYVLPVKEIARLCIENGVPFILDASQSAGVLPVYMSALGAAFVAMPGHKGLMGPQGTGVLLCGAKARPIMAGGTGSESRSIDMPAYLPDMLEAGTHNITGIAGLLAGVRYVRESGTERISAHERSLCRQMARELAAIDGVTLFSSDVPDTATGVLSFCHEKLDCEEIGRRLGEKGVAVRAGLHCAPCAHETAGTIERGTVRISFSPFNTSREVIRAAQTIKNILV